MLAEIEEDNKLIEEEEKAEIETRLRDRIAKQEREEEKKLDPSVSTHEPKESD